MRGRLIFSAVLVATAACATSDPSVQPFSQIPRQDGSVGAPHPTPTPVAPSDASEDGSDADTDADIAAACPIAALSATRTCEMCILQQCVTPCVACAADPGCLAIWTCLNTKCVNDAGVTSTQCGLNCAGPYLSDTESLNLVFAFVANTTQTSGCITDNCSAECPSGP